MYQKKTKRTALPQLRLDQQEGVNKHYINSCNLAEDRCMQKVITSSVMLVTTIVAKAQTFSLK